uniref:NADH dehydrogenase [ubiquinone] 1 beta subcomplex subunit 7 n=1 Tax=Anas platyrhynchos platyrhynchos TaxID=8840 RepID=A0A493TY91_ANAPP
MVATPRQLSEGRVPLEQRDFCAHLLLQLLRCQRDAFPNAWACRPLRHHWDASARLLRPPPAAAPALPARRLPQRLGLPPPAPPL